MQSHCMRTIALINHHYSSCRQFACNMSSFFRPTDDAQWDVLAKKIKSSRKWINVNHCRPVKGDIDFTIISWNILSQDLIDAHSELYTKCSYNSLDWSRRCSKILKYLFNSQKNYKLICLQELNHIHYENDFVPYLSDHGYKSIYFRRGSRQDGCAIIYHADTFELDSYETVHLGNPNVIQDFQRQRDNVGIIALFRPRNRNSSASSHLSNNSQLNHGKFIVATTHLFFNPKRGDIKMSQLRLFLAEIWKAATFVSEDNVKQLPVIFCGDLNLLPNSPIYNFIVDGAISPLGRRAGDLSGQFEGAGGGPYINYENLLIPALGSDSCYLNTCQQQTPTLTPPSKLNGVNEEKESGEESLDSGDDSNSKSVDSNGPSKVSHKFRFSPVVPLVHVKTLESLASTSVQDEVSLVDYIFYTQNSNLDMTSKLSLLSYYELPTVSQLRSFGPLPNFLIPSDHLPVEARFLFHSYLKPKSK